MMKAKILYASDYDSEICTMSITPKNRGCVFVECLSRAMFLEVVTVTCYCDKLYFVNT